MPGLPEAESSDQSWMEPEPPKKLPVAGYSEFNPPPVPAPDREASARHMRKAILWLAVSVVCFGILLVMVLT